LIKTCKKLDLGKEIFKHSLGRADQRSTI